MVSYIVMLTASLLNPTSSQQVEKGAYLHSTEWVLETRAENGSGSQVRQHQWKENGDVVRECKEYRYGMMLVENHMAEKDVRGTMLSNSCDFVDIKDNRWVLANNSARSRSEFVQRIRPSWAR
jgi:hypothetical protein